ncbi:MAG: general stress protein CsbD [Nitrococcus mobilis]|nr:general stress protein CsbD [Nitrococcus mobilis]
MGWDTVQGDWQRHVGQIRILWSKLTEDELQQINGRRDMLIDKIHERYQLPKDAVEEQVKIFESRFDS